MQGNQRVCWNQLANRLLKFADRHSLRMGRNIYIPLSDTPLEQAHSAVFLWYLFGPGDWARQSSYLNLENTTRCCMVLKQRPDFAWSSKHDYMLHGSQNTTIYLPAPYWYSRVSRDKRGPRSKSAELRTGFAVRIGEGEWVAPV